MSVTIKANKIKFTGDDEYALALKGDAGPQGIAGEQGIQGPKGDKGDKGDTGSQGIQGPAGVTPVKGVDYFTPSEKVEIENATAEKFKNLVVIGPAQADDHTKIEIIPETDEIVLATEEELKAVEDNVDNIKEALLQKQDKIDDLEEIRNNANSALQEVPVASPTTVGGVKVVGGQGLYLAQDGRLTAESAVQGTIDARLNSYKAITPAYLNYAVKASLTDDNKMVLTDSEKATACQTIGAEPKKGEWVLKGTITDGMSGVNVDMTGCTEMLIYGTASATGNCSINANSGGFTLIDGIIGNGDRRFYAKFETALFGMEAVSCKYISNLTGTYIPSNGSAYSRTNITVDTIDRINVTNYTNITSCDIKIYAR